MTAIDERPESFSCIDCGHTSTDRDEFIIVNKEPPSLSMDNPYPGYEGDVICKQWCEG
jgi:hypothetical protein